MTGVVYGPPTPRGHLIPADEWMKLVALEDLDSLKLVRVDNRRYKIIMQSNEQDDSARERWAPIPMKLWHPQLNRAETFMGKTAPRKIAQRTLEAYQRHEDLRYTTITGTGRMF